MSSPAPIVVGGLVRFSLVDWPGRIVATVFCQGCGWRCRYCHNPALVPFAAPGSPPPEGGWAWGDVMAWLRDRRGLLDGVVFSGGEPLLQPGLAAAIGAARELGFRAGLHTGGPVPRALGAVLPLLDWVGLDYKAPFADYVSITSRHAGEAARESLRVLRAAGVAFEVRTTWHPDLLPETKLGRMADELVAEGVGDWVIQPFRAEGCADAALVARGATGRPALESLARDGLTVRLRE